MARTGDKRVVSDGDGVEASMGGLFRGTLHEWWLDWRASYHLLLQEGLDLG